MSEFTYLGIWDVDTDVPSLPVLMRFAEPELEAMAAKDRVDLLGPARWQLLPGRLVALAPARQIGIPPDPQKGVSLPWERWPDV